MGRAEGRRRHSRGQPIALQRPYRGHMAELRHGEIVLLPELRDQPPALPATIRVTAALELVDPLPNIAVISRGGARLAVDVSFLKDFSVQPGSLCQFIGELHSTTTAPAGCLPMLLRARVFRCMDGLDMALYEQVVHTRRRLMPTGP